MEIRLWIRPVPLGDDDIAFHTLWSWGRYLRIFARGDAIRPVAEQGKDSGFAKCAEAGAHSRAGLSGLNAPIPRRFGVGELAKCCWNFTGALVSNLMTGFARIRFQSANPLSLAGHARSDAVAAGTGPRELGFRGDLQQ